MNRNVISKLAYFFVLWGLVFVPCISGCANNKGFFRETSESEKSDKTTAFFDDSDEKDDTFNAHPVALHDEDGENPKTTSFWNRFSLMPINDPYSEEDEFGETETETKRESSLLADAEKAEKLLEYDKAEKLYRQFISEKNITKTKSESARAYGKYGILLARKGDYELAERMLLKSLDINPNDHEIAGAYSQALYEQKRYSESAAVARDVVNRHGEDPRICYFLGESLLSMQRYQEGFRYLKKAIGEPEARVRMAQSYYSEGDVDAARYAMQKHDQYYISRGMTPPERSSLQQLAAASPQRVTPIAQAIPTPLFSPRALPVPAAQSAFPPDWMLKSSMHASGNGYSIPHWERGYPPQPPMNRDSHSVSSQNVYVSSYQTSQSENPLSHLQSQRKPSLMMPQTQIQHASVKVATPLTLSQKVSVSKESKIE